MKMFFIFLTSGLISLNSQNKTHLQDIDGIAAIVDDNLVLLSDINQSLAMAVFQNNWDPSKDIEKINNFKGQITQNFIDRKVILSKALLDSITVEDTASFWDAGEFIAVSNKLEVPHPPGAPF